MISEKENFYRMLKGEDQEFVTSVANLVQIVVPSVPVDRPENGGDGKDGFGVLWTTPVGQPQIPDPNQKRILEDIEDWEDAIRWPDLEKIDWAAGAARDIPKRNEKKLILLILPSGPFERLHDLMGFEDALVATVSDPESCKEYFTRFCDFRIEQMRYLKEFYKPDIIQIQDDWGSQKDLLFNPEFWEYALRDNIKRLIDAAHEMGMIFNMHSCGKIDRIIDQLVALGPDIIDSMMVCNDLDRWMDVYGRKVIFMGGLDTQGVLDRSDAKNSDINREIKSRIRRYAPKGNYMPMPYCVGPNMGPALLYSTIDGYLFKKPWKNWVRIFPFFAGLKEMTSTPGAN